jgi:hypothetical protein
MSFFKLAGTPVGGQSAAPARRAIANAKAAASAKRFGKAAPTVAPASKSKALDDESQFVRF